VVLGRLHHSIGNLNSLYGIVWFECASENVLFVLRANLRGTFFRDLAYGAGTRIPPWQYRLGEKGLV
jgi:hypothetical protein